MVVYDLPVDYLAQLLRYDPQTGALSWIVPRRGPQRPSREAGSKRKDGYVIVSIDNRRYFAHRIAYALHYQKPPDGFIDHINGDPGDNRIENLRLVDSWGNQQNRRCHRNGKTPGTFQGRNGSWIARIGIENRSLHLGTFATEAEAQQAYERAVNVVREIESSSEGHPTR